MAYLDNNGVIFLWNKIKTVLFNKSITDLSANGQTIMYTKGDGTTGIITTQDDNTTYDDFSKATSVTAGTHGLVPAPGRAHKDEVLFADVTWRRLNLQRGGNTDTDKFEIQLYSNSAPTVEPFGAELSAISIPSATVDTAGVMSGADKAKLNALPTSATLSSTYAKKSEITNMYKYCGSVTGTDKLPTNGQRVGDVYNIEAASKYGGAGMNVAWNGTAWDPLGEIFTITAITNAQIDAICV